MTKLVWTEFGDPILRQVARRLSVAEVSSPQIQTLITTMRGDLLTKQLGIALAAPQVGESVALAVVTIRPTKHRPKVEPFDLVLINPHITQTFGKRKQMWEGCLSAGKSGLFALVPRYKAVEVEYIDQHGRPQRQRLEGLRAQVVQHETDHLNGVLFVDHVRDPHSYMTLREYKKHIAVPKTP
jgi:peptide deformylase